MKVSRECIPPNKSVSSKKRNHKVILFSIGKIIYIYISPQNVKLVKKTLKMDAPTDKIKLE